MEMPATDGWEDELGRWLAPFLASLRGAFRLTYGFGFIYDRNFFDENTQNNR